MWSDQNRFNSSHPNKQKDGHNDALGAKAALFLVYCNCAIHFYFPPGVLLKEDFRCIVEVHKAGRKVSVIS